MSPRVAGHAEGGIFGGTAHGKLIHVQAAEDDGPGLLELAAHGGIVGGNKVAEDFGSAIEGMVLDGNNVLGGDGDTEEGEFGMGFALCDGLVGEVGIGEGPVGVQADEGVEGRVCAADLVEAGLHGLAGGDLAPGEFAGQFRNCEFVQHRFGGHQAHAGIILEEVAWCQ